MHKIHHYMKLHISKLKSHCLYLSKSCAEMSRCFAYSRTLRVVGGCRGWYFCYGGSMGATTQMLLLLPVPQVNTCGLELILVTTYLIWIPAPCPEWPHSCPRGALSTQEGRDRPPLRSSSLQFEECRVFQWRRRR